MSVAINTLENEYQSIYWKDAAYCETCGYVEGNIINDFINPLRHSGCKADCQESWNSDYITNCLMEGRISIEEQNYCNVDEKYRECLNRFQMGIEEEAKRKQDEKEARLKKQQDIDEKYRECLERLQMAAEEEFKRYQDQIEQINNEADMRIKEEETEEIKRSHIMYGYNDDGDFNRDYYDGCDEV